MSGLLGVDAGGQTVLARINQMANDALDQLRSFPLAKNHFRKAAALAAVQNDVRETDIGDRRLVQPAQCRLHAE
jgi:hypothetical protein